MRRFTLVLVSAIVTLAGGQFAFAADEDEAIEEIVVTGSYLKRNAADSPSPLSVITSADIEDLGASDVSEIIQAMPWQSGSQTRASTFQGEGADGRNNINLRNLGHAATLPLVNGRRHVPSWYNGRGNASVNVNGLIPNIALERIEIVKDGSSALYGSDAIAGVVNFITKSDFEGFDFTYQFTTDDKTGEGDASQAGFIWGIQGDRGGVVASASFLNRDEINIDDDYGRFGGTTLSSTGNPGRLTPTGSSWTWADHGLEPGVTVDSANPPRDPMGLSYGQADVNCEDEAALERGGALGNLFNRCVYDYGSFFSIQGQESMRKFMVEGHYDITDDLEVQFEFASNDAEFDRLNSLNPNAPALTIPVSVPYMDANGVQQWADNPGSHEDAWRRGIEPIPYSNLTRLLGGTRNTPKEFRPLDTFTNRNRSDNRMSLSFVYDMEINGKSWTIDASYTASDHREASAQVQDTLSAQMELAINGRGGPNCDVINGVPGAGNQAYAASGGDFDAGDCYFFNPFGNNMFDRDGNKTKSHDLTLVNPVELYKWLSGRASHDGDFRQRVMEVVAAGDLWDTNAGPVGMAIGFQRRRDSGDQIFDSAMTTNNLDFVYGAQDWSGALTTTAFFLELSVPIGDQLEINAAGRYEDFDEIGEDTIDPKLTLLWRPTDSLSVRASAGSSFRAPSLIQSFGKITTVANQQDVVGGTTFKPSLSVGNPNLTPETADTVNFGFSWVPTEGIFEGLSIDVDYYDYEYTDIITRQSTARLLAEDNAALTAYVEANPGSTYVDAVNAGAGNRAQIIRNSNAIMLRALPELFNAQSADISGIDLTASYRFDNAWGNWRVGLMVAYVDEYTVEANGTAYDGVGSYNNSTPLARPLPEYKANATLSWSKDNHRAFLIVKHVDELESDISGGARFFFGAVAALAGNPSIQRDLDDTKIESFTTADVQYTYSFGDTVLGLSDANITLGIQNVTDEEPPVISVVTAYDGRLHDGRGRIWFARVGGSL